MIDNDGRVVFGPTLTAWCRALLVVLCFTYYDRANFDRQSWWWELLTAVIIFAAARIALAPRKGKW